MKIGFDAKRYFHNSSGLGNYSRDLVDTMIALYPSDKFYLFDNQPDRIDFPRNTIVAGPGSRGVLWRQFGIMKEIKLHLPDVYHGLSGELPFGKWPAPVKKVVTIHDVIFRVFPDQYPVVDRSIYDLKTRHALKCADIVVATSQATKNDISSCYGDILKDVRVIYQTCGVRHWMKYAEEDTERYRIQKKLPDRFILFVSSFQRRKNHAAILRAMQFVNPDIRVVFAGMTGPELRLCKRLITELKLENKVMIHTDINKEDLPLLYRAASGFIYPSMIEGFGIPLLEAACAGLPIAYNNIPVFRELSPQTDLAFQADDRMDTANAINRLWTAEKRDHSEFLNKFKPEIQVESMMELYREIAG